MDPVTFQAVERSTILRRFVTSANYRGNMYRAKVAAIVRDLNRTRPYVNLTMSRSLRTKRFAGDLLTYLRHVTSFNGVARVKAPGKEGARIARLRFIIVVHDVCFGQFTFVLIVRVVVKLPITSVLCLPK